MAPLLLALKYVGDHFLILMSAIFAIISYIFGRDHFLSKVQSSEIKDDDQLINIKDEYEKVDENSINTRDNGQSGLINRMRDESK